MRSLVCAFLFAGCVQQPTNPPVQTTSAIDRHIVQQADAMARYRKGEDAEQSDQGKAAYRRECLVHQTDREILLDQGREHAQIHSYEWHEWYRLHCVEIDPGKPVVDRATGNTVDAWACDADAGAAPSYWYKHTPEEGLARAQRDACERAQ